MSMLRVYCSRYMTDWDRYFPQVIGAYNSTQHSITGVSPHMMLSGHEKSLTLNFFYSEYEGKKTSPQVYVRNVIRRQQELNDLCRRNTQQEQASQRKKLNKKAAGAKAYSVGDYVWVSSIVIRRVSLGGGGGVFSTVGVFGVLPKGGSKRTHLF